MTYEIVFSDGAEDKKPQLFGKASGCRFDYGHIDLVLGRWAADEEIFPHIHNWLDSHRTSLRQCVHSVGTLAAEVLTLRI